MGRFLIDSYQLKILKTSAAYPLKMEIQDADRIVIAKPIASRPSCSTIKSFSALLLGAVNTSSPSTFSEAAVVAIRPKTVRLKPAVNQASVAVVSSQGGVPEAVACCSSERVPKPETKTAVVYKPLAKLISSKTAHLLANLGSDARHGQAMQQDPSQVQRLYNQSKQNFETQMTPNIYQKPPSQAKSKQVIEPLKVPSENTEENQRALLATTSADRPSYDGYNWRKYGQKQVKGSEYPRSYYKCTHPNCPVKKKVERSLDGQIAEIVYKGEHNHPKPQPPKRHTSGLKEQVFASDGSGQETRDPLWSSHLNERTEGSESRLENQIQAGSSLNPSYMGKTVYPYDSMMVGAFNSGVGTTDNSCGLSEDFDEGSIGVDPENDQPKSKRRKNEHQANEVGIIGQATQPRVVVQNSTDSEILCDGFRWRKYGQKVVKGNPNPRSYYRCTNIKCNVRKHVEKALDDPKAFITTYEGKHNHEMPATRSMNPVPSDPDSAPSTMKSRQ